jgi:nuclear pore complex protein Nup107
VSFQWLHINYKSSETNMTLSYQSNGSGRLSFGAPRNAQTPSDPLQPLRTMADRVGKEVEKFAERVDHWHTHGNDSAAAKYQTTVKMVGKFRDVAESHVRELKKTTDAENKGELNKSVRRRIQTMAEAPDATGQGDLGQSTLSSFPSVEPNADLDSASVQELRQWQAELATWELLRIIIDHYHPEPGADIAAERQARLDETEKPKRYGSNKEIWERFLLEDDQAKEKALILRWLEQTAQSSESDINSITAELEAQSGKGAHTWTSGWLDTKSKIKQAKRIEGTDQPLKPGMATIKTADKTQNLVTQLDPDAPARQKRALERSDEFYERALWMVCYEMMRRGVPWKDIYEWSLERNEAWRGVSIGAATDEHPKGCPNVSGDSVGYLFRRMCFYAARGARIPYEGAVYGLLSGDVKQVQAVCRTWDDHLHAHYNALLLSRFDFYLQRNFPDRVSQSLSQKFVFQDAASNIGSWEDSPRTVINMLKQQKATAGHSVLPMKLIQGALISRSIEELVHMVGIALADMLQNDERAGSLMVHPDSAEKDRGPKPVEGQQSIAAEKYYQALATDPHAFRILVHMFIALREGMGMLSTQDVSQWFAMDNVIAAYIEFLRISKRIQLIPLYAAQLDEERAYHCLARVLPDIKNSEEQQRCIALLGEYRVDAIEVVSQSFTFAFNHSGFIHFDNEGFSVITNPIERFVMIEATDHVLWPGIRIKSNFGSSHVEAKEESVIEALHWYHYLGKEDHMTFEHLANALTIFLRKYDGKEG